MKKFMNSTNVLIILAVIGIAFTIIVSMKNNYEKELATYKEKESLFLQADLTKEEKSEEDTEIDMIEFLNPNISVTDAKDIKKAIGKYYKETELHPLQLYALCSIESGLNKKAVSPAGDSGLCQISKSTYKGLVRDKIIKDEWQKIFNIDYNVKISALILTMYRKDVKLRFPNESKEFIDYITMASYNRNMGGIFKELKVKKDSKMKYSEKIINRLQSIDKFLENKHERRKNETVASQ